MAAKEFGPGVQEKMRVGEHGREKPASFWYDILRVKHLHKIELYLIRGTWNTLEQVSDNYEFDEK